MYLHCVLCLHFVFVLKPSTIAIFLKLHSFVRAIRFRRLEISLEVRWCELIYNLSATSDWTLHAKQRYFTQSPAWCMFSGARPGEHAREAAEAPQESRVHISLHSWSAFHCARSCMAHNTSRCRNLCQYDREHWREPSIGDLDGIPTAESGILMVLRLLVRCVDARADYLYPARQKGPRRVGPSLVGNVTLFARDGCWQGLPSPPSAIYCHASYCK